MKRAIFSVLLAILVIPFSAVTAFADDKTAPSQMPGRPGAAPGQMPGGGGAADTFVYYESAEVGIALAVPSTWVPVNPNSGPLAQYPAEMRALIKFVAVNESTGANAVLIQGPATGPNSLAAIEERHSERIQQLSNLVASRVLDQERVLLPSGEALVTSGLSTFRRSTGETQTLAQVSVQWVHGDVVTVLTLTADSDDLETYAPIFEEIVESFRFL